MKKKRKKVKVSSIALLGLSSVAVFGFVSPLSVSGDVPQASVPATGYGAASYDTTQTTVSTASLVLSNTHTPDAVGSTAGSPAQVVDTALITGTHSVTSSSTKPSHSSIQMKHTAKVKHTAATTTKKVSTVRLASSSSQRTSVTPSPTVYKTSSPTSHKVSKRTTKRAPKRTTQRYTAPPVTQPVTPPVTLPVPANAISVLSYGAVGNGVQNDTADIQAAINTAAQNGGGTVYIPNGTYMIDAVTSLQMQSNVTLMLAPGAVLKAIPNGADKYFVIQMDNVTNVTITGGTIEGDRAQHTGTSGEYGMGIGMYGGQNVTISNMTIEDCWGDGLYIGEGSMQNENVTVSHVTANNNRRNGITLITGANINITDCTVENTHGTAPSDGLDIEPNDTNNVLQNISVMNLTSRNNAGNGLEICTENLSHSGKSISIRVVGQHDTGSAVGFRTSLYALAGTITVSDSVWSNEKQSRTLVLTEEHNYFHQAIHVALKLN